MRGCKLSQTRIDSAHCMAIGKRRYGGWDDGPEDLELQQLGERSQDITRCRYVPFARLLAEWLRLATVVGTYRCVYPAIDVWRYGSEKE